MKHRKMWLLTDSKSKSELSEVITRIRYYLPEFDPDNLKIINNYSKHLVTTDVPVLVYKCKGISQHVFFRDSHFFNIDFNTSPLDGWNWHKLINYVLGNNINTKTLNNNTNITKLTKRLRLSSVGFFRFLGKSLFYISTKILTNLFIKDNFFVKEYKDRFLEYFKFLKKDKLNKVYLFGTGNSLSKAIEYNWDDGYRIVCNTIVRDEELWNHINPHFIVAGDAIYHFGFTSFAKAFRKDLKKRLQTSNTKFVYPLIYHELIKREFSELSQSLIPVPIGNIHNFHYLLTKEFELPSLGNVLNLLLLPLGCTLAKNVYLWGFDGRSPNDKNFWSNSNKHTYSEFLSDLQKAHPAFFNHFLPKDDTQKYIQQVHGDKLEKNLQKAERKGWSFNMMHFSWTETLNKRYKGADDQ